MEQHPFPSLLKQDFSAIRDLYQDQCGGAGHEQQPRERDTSLVRCWGETKGSAGLSHVREMKVPAMARLPQARQLPAGTLLSCLPTWKHQSSKFKQQDIN